jgi:hypothetical protein
LNQARVFALLSLALIVVVFVATWLTIPAGRYEVKNLTTGQYEPDKSAEIAKVIGPGPDRLRRFSDPWKAPPDSLQFVTDEAVTRAWHAVQQAVDRLSLTSVNTAFPPQLPVGPVRVQGRRPSRRFRAASFPSASTARSTAV